MLHQQRDDALGLVGLERRVVGRTPLLHWFPYGPAELVISEAGYLPVTRTLRVTKATAGVMRFELVVTW